MPKPRKIWEKLRFGWSGHKTTRKAPDSKEMVAGYRAKPRRSARIIARGLTLAAIGGTAALGLYHGGRMEASKYQTRQANALVAELSKPGLSRIKEKELAGRANFIYAKVKNREQLLSNYKGVIEPVMVGGGILAGVLFARRQRRMKKPVRENKKSIARYEEDLVVSEAQIDSELFNEKFRKFAKGNLPVKAMEEIIELIKTHGRTQPYLRDALKQVRRFVYLAKVKSRDSQYALVFTNNPTGLYFVKK